MIQWIRYGCQFGGLRQGRFVRIRLYNPIEIKKSLFSTVKIFGLISITHWKKAE